ncbi:DUF2953 domain-containing protein [Fervidibacillus halotolerans]|uniref:DUF2953 domain-containing protein n=1 Tax=Fervidibacillus halotolerans TaxID=2980027 RepID=A0A9E8RZJ1_9BACI|nr:DUF2953 domain-containing protein [Fervidibacillus halotolerans]WAA11687.1 DUF2953 domain-containing protein [Fervidibacillus halotolerans]
MLFMIGILFFLFFLLFFCDIRLHVSYSYIDDDNRLHINISTCFGLLHFKKSFPSSPSQKPKKRTIDRTIKGRKQEVKTFGDMDYIFHQILQFLQIGKSILKYMRVHQLEWRSAIGMEDAAQTGVFIGLGWTVKGNIIGMISRYTRLKMKPKVHIQPIFNQNIFETFLRCIVRIRLGYAILAGIQILRYWKREIRNIHPENEVKKGG